MHCSRVALEKSSKEHFGWPIHVKRREATVRWQVIITALSAAVWCCKSRWAPQSIMRTTDATCRQRPISSNAAIRVRHRANDSATGAGG